MAGSVGMEGKNNPARGRFRRVERGADKSWRARTVNTNSKRLAFVNKPVWQAAHRWPPQGVGFCRSSNVVVSAFTSIGGVLDTETCDGGGHAAVLAPWMEIQAQSPPSVTAPRCAEFTSRAYLASTPRV